MTHLELRCSDNYKLLEMGELAECNLVSKFITGSPVGFLLRWATVRNVDMHVYPL